MTPVLGLAAYLVLASVAVGQTPQAAPPHETPRLAAPNAAKPPPEQVRPPSGSAEQNDGNMSDRLSRQQGMLQPPTVDPGIHAPLPSQSAPNPMPVIPPPGSPGGDPKVVPK